MLRFLPMLVTSINNAYVAKNKQSLLWLKSYEKNKCKLCSKVKKKKLSMLWLRGFCPRASYEKNKSQIKWQHN